MPYVSTVLKIVAIVIGVAIAVAGLLGRLVDESSPWFWVCNILAVVLVGVQGFIGYKALKGAKAAQEEFKLVVYDQLGPLARELTLFARLNVPDRRARLAQALQVATNCAVGLAHSTRVRATVYRRTKTQEGFDCFEPHTSQGRGDRPQTIFVKGAGSEEGDDVWKRAEEDVPRFVRSVKKEVKKKNLPGWDETRVRSYKTFITVPIRAGDDLVGLLTINAPKPGDLSNNDVLTMQVMAGLLGTALGMANLQWPVRGV